MREQKAIMDSRRLQEHYTDIEYVQQAEKELMEDQRKARLKQLKAIE